MTERPALAVGVDYELFFGARAGTPERCLIEPTEALAACLEPHGARLVLFVDAGYLVRARRDSAHSPEARRQYDLVASQLARLAARGHDVQLHIHPHWEDSTLEGGEWRIRTDRYRLADFDDEGILSIVSSYRRILEEIKGGAVTAYRAGGWCIQPFSRIRTALLANGVLVDSTVYAGGHNPVEARAYDFRRAPQQSSPWRFDADPLQPVAGGAFVEVPISSFTYGAALFWRMALSKLAARAKNRPYGDGAVIAANRQYYLQRLLRPTQSPVSIDGFKAGMLDQAFVHVRNTEARVFNVMGHPKTLTRSGVASIRKFLERRRGQFEPLTFADRARIDALVGAD